MQEDMSLRWPWPVESTLPGVFKRTVAYAEDGASWERGLFKTAQALSPFSQRGVLQS